MEDHFLKINPDINSKLEDYKSVFLSEQAKDSRKAENYMHNILNGLLNLLEDDKALGLDNPMRTWSKDTIKKIHDELLEFYRVNQGVKK